MKNILTLILIVLFPIMSMGQSTPKTLDEGSFSKAINTGVVLVEFGASFGEPFGDWSKLKDCKYYRVDISKCPNLKKKYGIKVVPTIVVFDNGKVSKVYEGSIMFKMETPYTEIQKHIKTILSSKF